MVADAMVKRGSWRGVAAGGWLGLGFDREDGNLVLFPKVVCIERFDSVN